MKKVACMSCGRGHQPTETALCYPVTDALVTAGEGQIDVTLTDCEFMAKNYPETFNRPPQDLCNLVPIGMMVKVIVEWPLSALPKERFWVEVTAIVRDSEGKPIYYGELRNRTLMADYGEKMGPIFPRNIASIDFDAFATKGESARTPLILEGAE